MMDGVDERTTWPILTFSPLAFSSTASSKTMFRKTCNELGDGCDGCQGTGAYIVAAQDADDLAAAIELDEQTAVEILSSG